MPRSVRYAANTAHLTPSPHLRSGGATTFMRLSVENAAVAANNTRSADAVTSS